MRDGDTVLLADRLWLLLFSAAAAAAAAAAALARLTRITEKSDSLKLVDGGGGGERLMIADTLADWTPSGADGMGVEATLVDVAVSVVVVVVVVSDDDGGGSVLDDVWPLLLIASNCR